MKNAVWKAILLVCAVVLVAAVVFGLRSLVGLIGFNDANAEKYTAGQASITDTVRSLDIDWVNGAVHIAYGTENAVLLSETANKPVSGDKQLHWWLDGDTLRVRFTKPGINLHWDIEKVLTVTLPEGFGLENVSISATSGDLDIPALKADRLTLETTSGDTSAVADAVWITCSSTSGHIGLTSLGSAKEITAGATSGGIRIDAASADTLTAKLTSGDVSVKVGQVGKLTASSTSGKIRAEAESMAEGSFHTTSGGIDVQAAALEKLNVDATSGDVTVRLPADVGMTAHVDTTSGGFTYGIPMTSSDGAYVCGDGSAAVRISTTSGDVRIDALK